MPIAVQQLVSSSLSLVDNLMVGSLGEAELSAVGVAIQLYFVNWMVMFGFTAGSTTFMAQFYGKSDMKSIRKTVGLAITICFTIGVMFFIAAMFFPENVVRIFSDIPQIIDLGSQYVKVGAPTFLLLAVTVPMTAALRATQQTRLPLYISIAAFGTNTFLNYMFIFGNFGAPKLGVAGAALATVFSRILELALVLVVVFAKKNIIAGPLREFFGWHKEFVTRVLNNAIPTTLNESLWGLGTAMYTAAYARVGVTEYAAVQASNTINNLFIMAAFSIGDATLILVGQKLGEGKLDYAYELAKKLLKVGATTGVVAGLLLILSAKPLISCFAFSPEAQHYAFLILIVYGTFMGLSVTNGIQITGTLRSGGDTKFAMISETCCVWLIGVPMAFISTMVFHLPIYIAVILVRMEDVVKFFILMKRFLSKRWVKNIVENVKIEQ